MNLPSSIQAFFDADKGNDGEALARTFAPDAVVKDEGRSHAGRRAVAAWWRATKAKYQHLIEPLDIGRTDSVAKVRARVTGPFSGSPVVRTFAFRLKGDEIAGLDITE
jgi:hypothetical protein